MADIYSGPFGSYTALLTMTSLSRFTMLANIVSLKSLIPPATPDDAGGAAYIAGTYAPDFDQISPQLAVKLRNELDRIHYLVSNAPVTN